MSDPANERPNLLFLVAHDLQPLLGCYGDPHVVTPNLDRLASQGTVFTHAYCQVPLCNPSRSSFFTGRYPDRTKVYFNAQDFRAALPAARTLPEHLMTQGYHTASVGYVFCSSCPHPEAWSEPELLNEVTWPEKYAANPPAFNRKGAASECADVPDEAYPTGRIADAAVQKLAELKSLGQPFCLGVGTLHPHLPFNAPRKYWDLYRRSDLAEPAHPHRPSTPWIYPDMPELRGYADMPKTGPLTAEQTAALRHGYFACVSYMDAQIGKVLDQLEHLGLAENTAVVFAADHGFAIGELGFWTKAAAYEPALRVPLIIRSPSHTGGQVTSALVELVDLYPTLVDLLDLPVPPGLEGMSLAPLLEDPGRVWKEAVYSQVGEAEPIGEGRVLGDEGRTRPWLAMTEAQWQQRDRIFSLRGERINGWKPPRERARAMIYSVRTQRWRFSERIEQDTGVSAGWELYDLERDPVGAENVAEAAENQELIDSMRRLLRQGPCEITTDSA